MVRPNSSALFLSLLCLLSFRTASSSVLEDVCSSLGDSYVSPDMCATVLSADDRSKTASNARALADIAVNITVAKADPIAVLARGLAYKAPDALSRHRAEGALRVITGAIKSLRFAKGSLALGNLGAAEALTYVAFRALLAAGGAVPLGKLEDAYLNAAFVMSITCPNLSSRSHLLHFHGTLQ